MYWQARRWDEDLDGYRFKALEQHSREYGHSEAQQQAIKWFKDCQLGLPDTAPTVADACRDYVSDLLADGRKDTAHDAEKRFERTVFGRSKIKNAREMPAHRIAAIRLDRLRTKQIKEWRNELGGKKSSQNRNLTALKAALNLAVEHKRVNPSVAQEWKSVKAHKNANTRRTLFLDKDQRRALVEAAQGPLRDLIEAAALTGARPGELVSARCSQFDSKTQSMTFAGKTGERTVPLSYAATKLLRRLAKGKLPHAYLLTNDMGRSWPHSGWDQGVRDAASNAKLPKDVMLYTLRHSWITEHLKCGMATLEVARLSGTSLGMIDSYYGHLVAEATRERLAAVDML